jgi:hypothetical protein
MRKGERGLPCSDVLVRPPSHRLGRFNKLILGTEQYGAVEDRFEAICCMYRRNEPPRPRASLGLRAGASCLTPRKKQWNMSRITRRAMHKLPKVSQPPLSHRGATPDSDRARRPPLAQAPASGVELTRGDRVEGLGDFGKPNGEFGTVQRSNEDDAEVRWDHDGCVRVHQPSLRKTGEVAKIPGRLKKVLGKLIQLRPELP